MRLREIDMRVAEKMFGIKYAWDDEWQQYGREDHEDYMCFHICPHYSDDIAAAWKVVERHKDDGYAVLVHWNPDRGTWLAALVQDDLPVYEPIEAFADTVPLAICLVTLKAAGVEVPA